LTGQGSNVGAIAQAAAALAANIASTKGQLGAGDRQPEIDKLKRELEAAKK
jgi:hypothetical protein